MKFNNRILIYTYRKPAMRNRCQGIYRSFDELCRFFRKINCKKPF